MSWAPVALLALAVFGMLAFLLKAPRKGWEAIGAALLLGIAGYALQGRPGLPGAPKTPAERVAGGGDALIKARQELAGKPGPVNDWLVIADALARHGQFADAAEVLRGAVDQEPGNAEAWLALGNALVGHSQGLLTPAALFAYRRAAAADPDHPGPPFFLGLALAQSGRFAEARALWAGLLALSPKDAPWRADLADRLARLDAFIAARNAAGPAR
jgi:cytochrome c-type biogenesis protein CcmH